MKQKLKDFFSEKKELFLFLGVLVAVFAMILTIASLNPNGDAGPVINTNSPSPSSTEPTETNKPTTVDKTILETMCLPIDGEYEIVRYYFDTDNAKTMAKAVIYNGETFTESKGVSYAKASGEEFNCLAVFSGTVKDVTEDSVNGTSVKIEHSNDTISIYYSLRGVTLKVGDKVNQGDVIGTAGISALDPNAGIHVHLEILKNETYINPLNAYGKKTSEISIETMK